MGEIPFIIVYNTKAVTPIEITITSYKFKYFDHMVNVIE